jgi:hypothetical protein
MNDRITFKRIAAISAMLAAPATLASAVVLLMVVDFNSQSQSGV